MACHFTAEEKLILLNKIKHGHSITKVSREEGISRAILYRWLKTYNSVHPQIGLQALSSKTRKNEYHWKSISDKTKKTISKLAVKQPELSIAKIAKQTNTSVFTVWKVLKENGLNQHTARKAYVERNGSSLIRELSSSEKVALMNRYKNGDAISMLCRDFSISRTLFYKWYKRYQFSQGDIVSLVSRRPKEEKHWRFKPGSDKLVLDIVSHHPEFTPVKISKSILQETGKAVIGSHGIYNLLKKLNLNTYQKRLAFVASKQQPVSASVRTSVEIPDWKSSLFGKIPSISSIPPPPPARSESALSKFFGFKALLIVFLGFFAALSIFGIYSFASFLLHSPSLVFTLGALFSMVALCFGMFFFLYSIKIYFSIAGIISFSRRMEERKQITSTPEYYQGGTALQSDTSKIEIDRLPFISIHVATYNESRVIDRFLRAVTSMDYPNFEVIVVDDSIDQTVEILNAWKYHPRVKIIHRQSRQGFKGGALREAIKVMNAKTEFVAIFDADFIPYPDTIMQFLKYFKASVGSLDENTYKKSAVSAVQGYQWHVLNKSENWITRGVRSEYAGSYVIERSSTDIYGGLKQISGSVYLIRADVLKEVGWGTSLTEDFELTLKLYQKGYKVVFTPYIQAAAEAVSTIRRLIKQRMRWAEGHSFNVKKMFKLLMRSEKLTFVEKLEFLYLSPYYLQAFFFMVGTFSWFLAEVVFQVGLPFWTSTWGWSLVFTNLLAIPLMNMVGLFLEESEEKDYLGIFSFVVLSYIVAPFQGYAAVKGFLEKEEGPWFRTPKTGRITDVFTPGKLYKFIFDRFGRRSSKSPALNYSLNRYLALNTAHNVFFGGSNIHFKPLSTRKLKWVGNVSLVALLIFSTLVFAISPAIPVNNTITGSNQAAAKEITTPIDVRVQIGSNNVLMSQNGPIFVPGENKSGKAIDYIFHKEPRLRIKLNSKEIEFETKMINEKYVKPDTSTIEDQRVTYKNIQPNIDLVYEVDQETVSEKFILNQPLTNFWGERARFEGVEQELKVKDLRLEEKNGQIGFFNEIGSEILHFAKPSMYEQNNSEVKSGGVKFVLEKTQFGYTLKKKLTKEGQKWLNDPARNYPVVIDPTVSAVDNSDFTAPTQRFNMQSFVKTSEGTYHVFFWTGTLTATAGCSTLAGLLHFTSTDTVTWTCQNKLNSAVSTNVFASAVVDTSDNIYVAYAAIGNGVGTTLDVFYRKFTFSAGSWTMEAEQTAVDSTATDTGMSNPNIELEGTTRLWLSYRYLDNNPSDVFTTRVIYSADLTLNTTWTASATLDAGDDDAAHHIPRIVRYGTNIGVIYRTDVSNDDKVVWRNRADADGLTTWNAEATITDTTAGPGNAVGPGINATVDNSNNIHLGYFDTSAGTISLYYKYYNGSTWSSAVTLQSGNITHGVAVSTDGSSVWFFWTDLTNTAVSLGGPGQLVSSKCDSPFTSCGTKATAVSYERTFDKVWLYDGTTYEDLTTAAGNATTADIKHSVSGGLFGTDAGDFAYFGMTEQFRALNIVLSTNGAGGVLAYEYWNGSAWGASSGLSGSASPDLKGAACDDTTNGVGCGIWFDVPSDWATTTVNGEGTSYYYVRMDVTTAYTTRPIGSQARAFDSHTHAVALKTASSVTGIYLIWGSSFGFAGNPIVTVTSVPENHWVLLLAIPFMPKVFVWMRRRRYEGG